MNLYGFVGNDGINQWDLLGLAPFAPDYGSADEAIIAGGEYALDLALADFSTRLAAYQKIKKAKKLKRIKYGRLELAPKLIYEYGGRVCCEQKDGKATGKFYYANAVTGKRTGALSMLRIKMRSKCKDGDKSAGYYHNHPKDSELSGTIGKKGGGDMGVSDRDNLPIGATGRDFGKVTTRIYHPEDNTITKHRKKDEGEK